MHFYTCVQVESVHGRDPEFHTSHMDKLAVYRAIKMHSAFGTKLKALKLKALPGYKL